MPGSWAGATLGSIATTDGYGLVDGPFGSNLPASLYTESGIPVIRGSNLTLGTSRFRADEFVFVSPETAKRMQRSLCRPFDIVFTKKGTLGQTGLVPDRGPYDLYLLSSNQMKLTVDRMRADPLFVYYFVSSPESIHKIIQDSEATGVPKTNVTYLREFPIVLPPLAEQRAIAEILGALDDKIELNRRMNETLEAMARAIFKSWFVDFDPVRAKAAGREPAGMDARTAALFSDSFEESAIGEIPRGWKTARLSDLCSTQYGYTASASPKPVGPKYLRVTDINKKLWVEWNSVPYCAIDEGERARYALEVGDILVARMADPGKAAIVEETVNAVFASYLVRLKASTLARAYFLFGFLTSPAYAEYSAGSMSGSVQANMNARVIVGAELVLPSEALVEAYARVVIPLRHRITANVRESTTLGTLRDALLPKLLSGELQLALRMPGACLS